MSLINDMLRDLEHRQRPAPDALAGLTPAAVQANGSRRVWLLVVLLLSTAGAASWYWLTGPAPTPGHAVDPVVEASSPPTDVLELAAQQSPAAVELATPRLTAIAVNRDADRIRLALRADRAVPQELTRRQDGVVLLLPGMELAAKLPDLAGMDPRVQTVDLRQTSAGTELRLGFSGGVRVQAAWGERQGGAELALDLYLPASQPEPAPPAQATQRPESVETASPVEPAAGAAEPLPQQREAAAPEPDDARPPAAEPRFVKQPMTPAPAVLAARLSEEGEALLAAGRAAVAVGRFREALGHDPDLEAARRGLVSSLLAADRHQEAETVLREGLARSGKPAYYAELLARLLMPRGDYGEAIEVLEQAAPARIGDGEYYALLAALYQRAGHYRAAAQTYQRLLEVHPSRGVWWMGLGLALEGQGDGRRAAEAYRRALTARGLAADVENYVRGRLRVLQ